MYKYYFRYLISILYLWMLLRFSYKDIWILERSILFLLDFTNPPQPITSPELAKVESKMDNRNITKNVQICFIVVDLASFDKIDKIRNPVSEKMWPVLFISGKCKRFPRHLLFLLWFSWRFKIAEVNGNRAEQGSIYFCKQLHDKLLWPIGGVVWVYTSQLNGTDRI